MEKQTYSITELSREFDLTPRTIRYYEDQGLVRPKRVGRTRVYSRSDRTRLKLTLRGKRLGLSLAEIKELINMYRGIRNDERQLQKMLSVLQLRRACLEQQKEDIAVVLHEIDQLQAQCNGLLQQITADDATQKS